MGHVRQALATTSQTINQSKNVHKYSITKGCMRLIRIWDTLLFVLLLFCCSCLLLSFCNRSRSSKQSQSKTSKMQAVAATTADESREHTETTTHVWLIRWWKLYIHWRFAATHTHTTDTSKWKTECCLTCTNLAKTCVSQDYEMTSQFTQTCCMSTHTYFWRLVVHSVYQNK